MKVNAFDHVDLTTVPGFKAKVALEAFRGEQGLAELVQNYDMRATQFAAWKIELLQGAAHVFVYGRVRRWQKVDLDLLHFQSANRSGE